MPAPARFSTLIAAVCLTTGLLAAAPVRAAEPQWHHGGSLTGEVKYPPDFKHFDYVNPNAPKGGVVRYSAEGTFDTFNDLIPQGNPAAGLNLIYDNLMSPAADEISSEYGLIAEAFRYPDDFGWVEYRLRPQARWHDGAPITVDDVIWSFEKSVALNPMQKRYYANVKSATKVAADVVRFQFDETGNRELPKIMGQLTVYPRHWWEGIGKDGKPRDIAHGTLEPPLGSGPYKLKSFTAGRSLVFERVPDYWGKDLPVAIGQNNFDELRFEYYRNDIVELEAFKGDQVDWRTESSSRNWNTAYDFPARRDGKVVLEKFARRSSGGMQAFILNLRLPKFQDPRVRQALNYAFDFEEMNKNFFFGEYERNNSYFAPTELAATGLPAGQELAILETVRDLVPPEVFTREFKNPVGGSPQAVRANLIEAVRLLKEAGYELRGTQMIDPRTNAQLSIEILTTSPAFERIIVPYRESLKRIGVDMVVRSIDQSQFINRVRNRDFEMLEASTIAQSLSPGNEQRNFFGSAAADQPGSGNNAGIKNAAVDKLIDRIIFAKDRAELVAATKALDRVLLWNHFVIPQWTFGYQRTARWDRFAHPEKMPEYGAASFPTIWWWDAEKAARTGNR
ncbi:MAG: ABC transporter substrate-binding protein [Hyphomicrobiaceae bacterium]|nr:ABC transporter substrate-binding protein [Hyphomicrobiaceae bacterium]